MGLIPRRNPYRHLPPPPASGLNAAAPTVRESTGLAGFTYPPTLEVGRTAAWTVPAVAAGLQVIAGTIGALPLERLNRSTWEPVVDEAGFLQQMDPEEPTSTTLTRLCEDLVLFPDAYLVVLTRYSSGYPSSARYVPAESVQRPTPDQPRYRITVDARTYLVDPSDVIRFPAPTPGLLATGARAIGTALAMEGAARRLADPELPAGAVKNNGPDLTDTQVDALLARWDEARRSRGTAYLSALLDFQTFQWDAQQLQLVEGRDHQVAEFARLLNVPTRYLNAPTNSSLTYSTTEGQRRELSDLTLRPYMAAIENRLSMGDVTPSTQVVRFDLDDFLRGDASERTTIAVQRIAAGITTPQEERTAEHIPGKAPGAPAQSTRLAPVAELPA